MPLVSVIIPVYNAEKLLNRCIDSLINSRIDELDFELILINDGSTDRSLEICKNYENQFDFIKVFDQKNQGPSAARNVGIQNANGDWIAFVDSDDFVEEDYFETIYKHLNSDIDVLIFGYCKINNESRKKHSFGNRKIKNEELKSLIKNSSKNMSLFWFPWNKVYGKDIIHTTRFNENIKLGEDTIFNIEAFLKSKSIKLISPCLYNYVDNQESLTQTKYSKNLLENMITHYESRKKVHKDYNLMGSEYKSDIASYYINHIFFWLLKNIKNNPNSSEIINDLKNTRNSSIFKECFKDYVYDWKHPKKSFLIKLFELRQFKILLKLK